MGREDLETRSKVVGALAVGCEARLHGGSRMSGDVHVRFCERLGVRSPGPTHLAVVCRGKVEAQKAMTIVQQIMARLKLQLHPTKTKLVNLKQEGFEFLGFHFQKVISKRSGKLVPLMWPGKKSMKAVRSQIRQRTERSALGVTLAEVVNKLNPVIRGWRNYFVIGHSMRQLRTLDRYVWLRLWKSAAARHGFRGCLTLPEFKTWFTQSGVEYFYVPGIRGLSTSNAPGDGCRKAV